MSPNTPCDVFLALLVSLHSLVIHILSQYFVMYAKSYILVIHESDQEGLSWRCFLSSLLFNRDKQDSQNGHLEWRREENNILLHTSLVYSGRKRISRACLWSVSLSLGCHLSQMFLLRKRCRKQGSFNEHNILFTLIALILLTVMEVHSVCHTQKMMMMVSLCRNNTQLSISTESLATTRKKSLSLLEYFIMTLRFLVSFLLMIIQTNDCRRMFCSSDFFSIFVRILSDEEA